NADSTKDFGLIDLFLGSAELLAVDNKLCQRQIAQSTRHVYGAGAERKAEARGRIPCAVAHAMTERSTQGMKQGSRRQVDVAQVGAASQARYVEWAGQEPE